MFLRGLLIGLGATLTVAAPTMAAEDVVMRCQAGSWNDTYKFDGHGGWLSWEGHRWLNVCEDFPQITCSVSTLEYSYTLTLDDLHTVKVDIDRQSGTVNYVSRLSDLVTRYEGKCVPSDEPTAPNPAF